MARWLATILAGCALSACDSGRAPAPEPLSPAVARALFAEHCVLCHGEDGSGHGLRRASLAVKPPDFRRAAWRDARTLESVRAAIRDGRPGSDMPSWARLGEREIDALARHVLAFAATGAR